MTLTAHEAWSRLLDRARQELPEQTFKTWLEPTEALSLADGVVFVGAPDQFEARIAHDGIARAETKANERLSRAWAEVEDRVIRLKTDLAQA